jgi:hypothetical protein
MIEVSLMGKISFHLKQRTEMQKEKQNRCNELDSKILIKFELIWKQGIKRTNDAEGSGRKAYTCLSSCLVLLLSPNYGA